MFFSDPVVAFANIRRSCVALSFQPLHCPLRQFVDDFDAVDPSGQLGEHCGLIAEASADFEDHVVRLELEQVRHQRLRDCFVETDRQRRVQVSVRVDLDRYELVPRWGNGPAAAQAARSLQRD
jgi:hypothetical protein